MFQLLNSSERWTDYYDGEIFRNRYIRGVIKRLMYFVPGILHRTKIVKFQKWHENYTLIGMAAVNCNELDAAVQMYQKLTADKDKLYWGLPVDWFSGKLTFPRGTMMSTTTSETILFFYELAKKRRNVVEDDVIRAAAYNLLNGLNRVSESPDCLLLSYTPFDTYKVHNANLLVAAALGVSGELLADSTLVDASRKIVHGCVSKLHTDGWVPYRIGGTEDTVDTYHQIFSIRALYYLKESNEEANVWFKRMLIYLENNLMNKDTGTVYLFNTKKIIDLQPTSEALRLYGMLNQEETYNKIYRRMLQDFVDDSGQIIQRIWFVGERKRKIKSNRAFVRQGLGRLAIALSSK